MQIFFHPRATALATVLTLHGAAHAINGAQLGGNGVRNASMGGASIALPLDANAAANNPAGMAFVPTSVTIDVQVFNGQSTANYVLPGNSLENKQTIPVPQGGFNYQISPSLSLGLSLATSGAGSDYGKAALPVPGAGIAKTSLQVAELIPVVAWKPRADLAVGFGINLAQEQFEASGVIVPAPVPGGLLPLPGHGIQSATGIGWRVGVLWQVNADWSFGANYKARTSMSSLSGYEGDLLAYSGGKLDVPEQYGIGLAWKATPTLTVAADWLQINWGDLTVMQDPNGFQWRNQPVTRVGAAWAMNDKLTLRAGVSNNKSQIDSARTNQNLLVPSIHETAWTAGVSWALEGGSELSAGYEWNPKTTLKGTGASTGTDLTSEVQVLMFGWQRRF